MDLESALAFVGLDQFEGGGCFGDSVLEDIHPRADSSVNLFRNLVPESFENGVVGGVVNNCAGELSELFGKLEYQEGVRGFVGDVGIMSPVLCYHGARETLDPNLIV